ncbi:MAG TPA: hypothetical protein VFJ43_16200 [Bacteroidia bacterium]|nr:hypothetical protein [Bacteroidia bacterium]
MIAVFKTNVTKANKAKIIVNKLQELFPDTIVNFDLKDCDKILRVENNLRNFETADVIVWMEKEGHYCEVLND